MRKLIAIIAVIAASFLPACASVETELGIAKTTSFYITKSVSCKGASDDCKDGLNLLVKELKNEN